MIVLDSDWKLLNYRVIYFPTPEMVRLMSGELLPNELMRVRQTVADVDEHPNLLQRSTFKAICVDLTKDIDTLRRQMDSTCRRWLRKAENLMPGVEIRTNDPATFHDFAQLYNGFASLNKHSGPISAKKLAVFTGVSDLYVAYHDGRAACGHLWLRDEGARRVRLIFSASSRLESKEDANLSGALNRYLHWMEIEQYKKQGFELYDMGGFEAETDIDHSLTRFKLSLGAFIVKENNYCFGRGLAKLAYRLYARVPLMTSQLRGRLPA
ncbi:MAG: GNAT family N-acetyltransferase [Candidatus Binataceae bacterium]